MGFFEKLDQLNNFLERVQEFFDDSLPVLRLSCDMVLQEKLKPILEKYAIYHELNAWDVDFHGFGTFNVEFVGKSEELENFKIVANKIVFDYLRSYYLGYVRTKVDTEKIEENQYIIKIYYAYNRKTLKNFTAYFGEIQSYRKEEVIKNETIIDAELEKELKEWDI